MKSIIYMMVLPVFLFAGFLCGLVCRKEFYGCTAANATPDTLVVHDTVIRERPVPVEIRIVDTLHVAVSDTVFFHDTSFVLLPVEQRVYEDSSYRAVISGYMPSLDSISVYPQTQYITSYRTAALPLRKRWGIGLQAGYGIYIKNGAVSSAPYIGVGVSYSFVRF